MSNPVIAENLITGIQDKVQSVIARYQESESSLAAAQQAVLDAEKVRDDVEAVRNTDHAALQNLLSFLGGTAPAMAPSAVSATTQVKPAAAKSKLETEAVVEDGELAEVAPVTAANDSVAPVVAAPARPSRFGNRG